MPVLIHAKKKLRQDVKRTRQNKKIREMYKALLKKARVANTRSAGSGQAKKAMSAAFSAIDKAAKQNIIHKNKAARLKSSLAKPGDMAAATLKKVTKSSKKVEKAEIPVAEVKKKPAAKKTTKKASKTT